MRDYAGIPMKGGNHCPNLVVVVRFPVSSVDGRMLRVPSHFPDSCMTKADSGPSYPASNRFHKNDPAVHVID
jgi:hypothetical protein